MFEISIFNIDEKQINFKIKLAKIDVYQLSTSMGKLGIGRHKQSLYLDFDDLPLNNKDPEGLD
jgi:hypothetical protein